MKKRICLLLFILLLCGCSKAEKKSLPKEEKKEEVPIVEEYKDLNDTPIAFYQLKGNSLTKISNLSGSYNALDDIGLFQIYPSNDETVSLNSSFASSFYEEYSFLGVLRGLDASSQHFRYLFLYDLTNLTHKLALIHSLQQVFTNSGEKRAKCHIK